MDHVVVVEPHADDAFLSLGGHIEGWRKSGVAVTIVTVFSATRKRAVDAERYAVAVGASWVGLGASEDSGPERLAEGGRATRNLVPRVLAEARGPLGRGGTPRKGVQLVGPLGIKHPDHQMVASTLRDLGERAWAYVDQPYASTLVNAEETNALLKGTRVVSWLKPHLRKYRHAPLFKDQAKFFYFNPPTKLAGNIELIVEV